MTKIALLCPTRARYPQLKRMLQSVADTSEKWVVKLYIGDTTETMEPLMWPSVDGTRIEFPDGMPTVHKWNMLAQMAMQDPDVKLFMLAADDIIFETPGWDEALIKHYEGLENKIYVYHLQDSRDPNGTPHPIVTREYIEAMGYFLPPIFLHWFADTWTVKIARSNDRFTIFRAYGLLHDKPSDRGQPDETHTGIRAHGWHDRDKHVNETCMHFLECEKRRLATLLYRYQLPTTQKSLASLA